MVIVIPLLLTLAGLAQTSRQDEFRTSRTATSADLEEGRRALEGRRFQAASDLLRGAVTRDPGDGEAWLLLGRANWADDRSGSLSTERAVDAFTRAVALDPRLTTPWGRTALEQLAVSAVRSERLDTARAAFLRLLTIERRPETRARYETQLDEIALDEGTYTPTASTRYGPTGDIIGPIGPLQMRTNRWFEKGRHTQEPVKAEAYYRKAMEVDPAMWQAHLNLGIALVHQRRFEEALTPLAEADARWRQANTAGPPHLRAHLWRLMAFLEMDRLADAAREVEVLVGMPDDPWVKLYVLRYLVAPDEHPTLTMWRVPLSALAGRRD